MVLNLACDHRREEANHELAIAHQEVRVSTEQQIFSAEQQIFFAKQDIFSWTKNIAHQNVRVIAEQEIFPHPFVYLKDLSSPLVLYPFGRFVHFVHLHVDDAAFASNGADDSTEIKKKPQHYILREVCNASATWRGIAPQVSQI